MNIIMVRGLRLKRIFRGTATAGRNDSSSGKKQKKKKKEKEEKERKEEKKNFAFAVAPLGHLPQTDKW
jgi:hypothetical protein